MNRLPPITLSRLDVQRLDGILYNLTEPVDLLESLESEIIRARVVKPTSIPADVVTMNSTVRFLDELTGRESTLTLVYPRDAGRPDTISVLAPAGTALLGMKVGRSIDWVTPSSRRIKLKVLELVYQPEADQAFHL